MRVAAVLVACGLIAAALSAQAEEAVQAEGYDWRKPGLWGMAITKQGQEAMGPITVQQCSEAATEPDILLSILSGQENCRAPLIERGDDEVVIQTRCVSHSVNVFESRLSMQGDFASAYSGEARTTMRMGFAPATERERIRFSANWLGPCPQGMQAGDMRLPNGVVVNVLRDKAAAEQEAKSAPPAPRMP